MSSAHKKISIALIIIIIIYVDTAGLVLDNINDIFPWFGGALYLDMTANEANGSRTFRF